MWGTGVRCGASLIRRRRTGLGVNTVTREIDEDLIEATIRRVAESKAAREAPAIEMPVSEAIAPDVEKPAVERAIEYAEREALTETPYAAEGDDDDDDIEVTPTSLMAASRARSSLAQAMSTTPDSLQSAGVTAQAPRPMREPLRSRPEPIRGAVAAREPVHSPESHDSGEITAKLTAIQRQLDDMTAMLRQLTAGESAPSIGPAWEQAAAATAAQRPPIFRDAVPQAQATDVEPDVIDTRPIPKPLPPIQVEPKRGFDLLPRSYRITVEDKRRGVDLVPLHRAMLSMDGVRDMSLLSYNNGVAIVALEMTEELNPDLLRDQVARAMSRDARVEVHNEHTMVVKLADE